MKGRFQAVILAGSGIWKSRTLQAVVLKVFFV